MVVLLKYFRCVIVKIVTSAHGLQQISNLMNISWIILVWWIMKKIINELVSTRETGRFRRFLADIIARIAQGVEMSLQTLSFLLYYMIYIDAIYSNMIKVGIPQIFSYKIITVIIIIVYRQYRETICSILKKYCVFFPNFFSNEILDTCVPRIIL